MLPNRRCDWWDASYHAARRPALLARNKALAALRHFFAEQDFVEVETACLQVSPGNETHLHAFEALAHQGAPLYLHTSPEFAAKKLLSAGEQKIFTLARCFRDREQGSPLHAREFTMLEWYCAGAPFTQLIEDSTALIGAIGHALGTDTLLWRGMAAQLAAPPQTLSVCEAFTHYLQAALEPCIDATGAWLMQPLQKLAKGAGVRVADDDSGGDIFSRIMTEKIEPHLGYGQLTFLTHYPMAEAALAQPCAQDPRFAERFELYACGVELANAFGELVDADAQRQRFETAMAEKKKIYGHAYPIDQTFLDALAVMPPASGIALGFDRLIMLFLGASHIETVIWAP